MAFENLEERFIKSMNDLYGTNSTRDKGDGVVADQPFLEFKPNDPNAEQTANDTRTLPIGSTARDLSRIGKFLVSPDGLMFMLEQSLLQTGNSIAETRVLNPAFVIGNVVPYLHIPRSLSNPSDFAPEGDTANISPASLDPNVGSAGRMQKETAADATSKLTGIPSLAGLLGNIAPLATLASLGSAFGIGPAGSTGVDERPEFDINGNLFSVQLRNGYNSTLTNAATNVQRTISSLESGNIVGAISAIGSLVKDATNIENSIDNLFSTGNPSFGDPLNSGMIGTRYFITDANNADMYLGPQSNSTTFTNGLFYKQPFMVDGNPLYPPAPTFADTTSNTPSTTNDVNQLVNGDVNAFRSLGNGFNATPSIGAGIGDINLAISQVTAALAFLSSSTANPPAATTNPAEAAMLHPELSMQQTYLNDARIQILRTAIQTQITSGRAFYSDKKITDRGFTGGVQAGAVLNPETVPTAHFKFGTKQYLFDRLNTVAFIQEDQNATGPTATTYNRLSPTDLGQDLIDIIFFDFGNKRSVPFRAFLSDLQENVQPEISDTKYIGRIDRNIVYVGVMRDISFKLRVQAFDSTEMKNVWKKINLLTGFAYPNNYGGNGGGFMVPPLVKLTIGDLYRNQPGYIKNIVHTMDTQTSWEIERGFQAPHGIDVSINFCIIEKDQMNSDSVFYPFGYARSIDFPLSTKQQAASTAQSIGDVAGGSTDPDAIKTADSTTQITNANATPPNSSLA